MDDDTARLHAAWLAHFTQPAPFTSGPEHIDMPLPERLRPPQPAVDPDGSAEEGQPMTKDDPRFNRGRPVPLGKVDVAAGLFVCESCDTLLPREYRLGERCCFMCTRSEPLTFGEEE